MNNRLHWVLSLVAMGSVALPAVFTEQGSVRAAEVTAHVVALDQKYFYNRLGAVNPAGMIFALRRDVVDVSTVAQGLPESEGGVLAPGRVALRIGKRPRPIVLRVNEGDTLIIHFMNLLADPRADGEQPNTRTASVHVMGLHLDGSIDSDGSHVGQNSSSLVPPGGEATYRYKAVKEGTYLMYSSAATVGGEGDGGSLALGLFGAVNVEPRGAEWFRSQVTEQELRWASTGTMSSGHPVINYDAVYPVGHPFAGDPILKMTRGGEIIHSDLNAVITGPGRGNLPLNTYPKNPVIVPKSEDLGPGLVGARSREEGFREFTVIFHDEIFAIQAFPGFFNDPVLSHTLHSVRDGFAINYGTGGVGAEIIANRLGVGPMAECTECKYEEFFLTSWAVGDPAMVVDVPANEGLLQVGPQGEPGRVGAKATRALYPDDPSNVHHSYIGDHVKFRNLHAGPKEHHIFHLHAHQWLFNPDDENSAYLDSQAVGPGSNYTYDITYNGAGNRNQTPGDAIFHCHFYPHFAQGMWELWRNHDTFEAGTLLDAEGKPLAGARALPDGEIPQGTPIPAIVPIPGHPMPPMPGTVSIVNGQADVSMALAENRNPGFPFYIPALAGHRPPHPPLDTVDDGGLPRHIITGGTFHEKHDRLDFNKELETAHAEQLPETGTAAEKLAMSFHATRFHPTFTPEGVLSYFKANGKPPVAGAPFADPCVDDFGKTPAGMATRTYKAAAIQLDLVMNKVGWHFPQSRILSLWGDVASTLAGTRPPEPLFFRANTNDCIVFHHTNLVPHVYEQDDFQVRTPTDIIGQHIHLVKFDVTSSDGSGNGFNYEDGTFSPGEVKERIAAIKSLAGSWKPVAGGPDKAALTPRPHPYFGSAHAGAQTTVQRWYVDDVTNNSGKDRTLRTIFTHDHFGPSTHQQAGLYASLVIEEKGSRWRDPETGTLFGSRFDGGPTSWRADILTSAPANSYREFLLQFADFQLAYDKNAPKVPGSFPQSVINPPAKEEVGLPLLLAKAEACPGGAPLPCPEAISAADVGTFTVNYRNEPLALRILDKDPDPSTGLPRQAAGEAGDLAFAYRSDVVRSIAQLNVQPAKPGPLGKDVKPGDPMTPIMRAYEGDRIQVRVQVGATEEGHNMTIHGMKWLQEASALNSGYRNSQMMGLSEHFEMVAPLVPAESGSRNFTDRIYQVGAAMDDQWNGVWGILRAYERRQGNLRVLPNNVIPTAGAVISRIVNRAQFKGVCPKTAPVRSFDVTAVAAQNALPEGTLVYNERAGTGLLGPLHDPTALLYVRSADLNPDGTLKSGVPAEPLILRANAGDCIEVTLHNRLPDVLPDLPGFSMLPMIVEHFNANQVRISSQVGLHPQLLSYDAARYNGVNVGLNFVRQQTARPGGSVFYRWYAGDLKENAARRLVATPVEFGATGLIPAEPIKQGGKGLVGALIVEPVGATWVEDVHSRASALVSLPDGSYFREFVLVFQDDVNLRLGDGSAVPNLRGADDAEDSAQKAFNYRSEPMWFRMGFAPDTPFELTRDEDFSESLSNGLPGVGGDPETPVFTAAKGDPVRFRVVQPAGHARNSVFALHGHPWQREPYQVNSTRIGHNPYSEVKASQEGIGPSSHFDMVLLGAAGGNKAAPVAGDYLYRNQASFQFDGGHWGIFRVLP